MMHCPEYLHILLDKGVDQDGDEPPEPKELDISRKTSRVFAVV